MWCEPYQCCYNKMQISDMEGSCQVHLARVWRDSLKLALAMFAGQPSQSLPLSPSSPTPSLHKNTVHEYPSLSSFLS